MLHGYNVLLLQSYSCVINILLIMSNKEKGKQRRVIIMFDKNRPFIQKILGITSKCKFLMTYKRKKYLYSDF